MRWGHGFPKDMGKYSKPLGPMGKSQMSKGKTHQTVNYLLVLPNHLLLLEIGLSWLLHGMGKV